MGSRVSLCIECIYFRQNNVVPVSSDIIAQMDENTVIRLLPRKPLEDRNSVCCSSIGGLDKEISMVKELVVDPLMNPLKFERMGHLRPPRGVLLYGPPGTGKTMIAKALGNDTGASLFVINGPDILGKHYGESEENLRRVFQDAMEKAPSIIFIDEIDSLCPKRDDVCIFLSFFTSTSLHQCQTGSLRHC